jgi:phosphatidylserine/phosphatidylglycerophosphate/cardiolipin synthase-like enzyme
MYRRVSIGGILVLLFWLAVPRPASALEDICDPAYRNCRTVLINLIRNETVGIDVGFWFMEDARYTTELIARHKAGVRVRVLVDPRANSSTPANADRLAELASAGIPMRKRTASGILHWKAMIFAGQRVVQFSGANYTGEAFKYYSPYTNYIDEAIVFTSNSWVVPPFMSKFDDLWTNTSSYANYANISGPLTREYPAYSEAGVMNFPPAEDFGARAVSEYNEEPREIDAIIYRITDRRHTDALIAARGRGVTVRLITEPQQYRDRKRLWHAWNVDRLYMAGVRIRQRAHAGLLHQKSTILRARGRVITGSSNWTTPSAKTQEEHNYFTGRSSVFNWFVSQFERKWNNSAGYAETTGFTPLPPDKPVYVSPASGTRVSSTVTLKWKTGPWAHKADVYFGTSSSPQLLKTNMSVSPNSTASLTISNLSPDRTYYWKIVSKTMADKTASGPVWTVGT